MRNSVGGKGFLVFIIILGAVTGALLGDILGKFVPALRFLSTAYSIGMSSPLVLDMKVLTLTLGLNFSFNIMSILGIVLAIILYRKC